MIRTTIATNGGKVSKRINTSRPSNMNNNVFVEIPSIFLRENKLLMECLMRSFRKVSTALRLSFLNCFLDFCAAYTLRRSAATIDAGSAAFDKGLDGVAGCG
jgi:hypothetical protein